ncbi:MAG: thioredoxin [Gammaproteobacteria bacterium]|nr:thioredoxin [Gammaproteobacteria bacterium]MDH5729446.1 thioredoxin [Gammaproteobacteria bacterium]
MSESPFIADVNKENFQQLVIEQSFQVPVFVDFWADWCNPCKVLMPMLAKLAEEYNGKFFLAKVNSDQQRELAAQFGVRSLPTVKVFKNGEAVEEFAGALPEPTIRDVIERNILHDEDFILQDATQMIAQGEFDAAKAKVQTVLEKNTSHKNARLLMAKIFLAQDQITNAQEQLSHITIDQIDDDEVLLLKAQLEFADALGGIEDLSQLQDQVLANPKDCALLYQFGAFHALQGNYEAAMESFLNVMRLDRKFNDDAGRKALLQVFNLLGGTGPLVTRYRSKMAMLLH